MTVANDLAVRRALEAAASNSLMAMAVGPGCACGRCINMESANKDPSLPHALGSCWQGVHGGQFRLAVTFAVHGEGSLFGVSAIKFVAQLSTFEFGHAQAAPAFGRADQSGIHQLEHLDASPLLTGHGNEPHLQQPSQPAVPESRR
jgi:hypothetical protein